MFQGGIAMSSLAKGMVLSTLVVWLTACASTTITESWKDPSVERIAFKKVLAMAIFADATLRHIAEDEMVRQMPDVEAVPSYTILSEADSQDLEKAKAKITAAGFDGVVTMRLVKSEQQVTPIPGAYPTAYPWFWGYYGYAWPTAYDPGFVRADTIVQVETKVYSLKDDRLVWTGLSETFNPRDAQDLVRGVAQAVAADLRKQGIIV
jgi:hypothetical protein